MFFGQIRVGGSGIFVELLFAQSSPEIINIIIIIRLSDHLNISLLFPVRHAAQHDNKYCHHIGQALEELPLGRLAVVALHDIDDADIETIN